MRMTGGNSSGVWWKYLRGQVDDSHEKNSHDSDAVISRTHGPIISSDAAVGAVYDRALIERAYSFEHNGILSMVGLPVHTAHSSKLLNELANEKGRSLALFSEEYER